MKLQYICKWDKIKEKTWSGTTYSLYKALTKKQDIINYSYQLNIFQILWVKLTSLSFKKNRVVINDAFNKYKDYFFEKQIQKLDQNKKLSNVIFVGNSVKCTSNAYTYCDLTLDSLLYFKENHPQIFQYSRFENISDKEFDEKRLRQLDIFNGLTGIFTMSKWLAENLAHYSKIEEDKIHWVGGGINIDINKIKEVTKTNNRILFVGRDFIRKGGDIVYEAFKILKSKYLPDAELYIAGPKECPVDQNTNGIIFLGELPPDKLSDYFNSCDIFCMPSRFEAYGLVFIEALVYGLPCIGRNNFSMKEFIEDGKSGYLLDNDNIDNLAFKMNELLSNRGIKEYVVANRQFYINNYSWDTVANRMIAVIEKNCII